MNANRMKYSSTPTYGMQKRGLKKWGAARQQAPEAPDFSKAPDPLSTSPAQTAYTMPQTAVFPSQPPYAQQPGSFTMPSYFQPPMNAPQQPAQIPFATPTFIRPGVAGSAVPPLNQPPLGNSAPVRNAMNAAYSPTRAQGYVPPQAARPAVQPAPIVGAPLYSNARPVPPAMPASPAGFGTSQGFSAQPQGFTAQPQGFAAQPQGFSAQPQSFSAQPQSFSAQPQGFAAQPQGFSAQPQASANQPPVQPDSQRQPVFTPRTPSRTTPRYSIADMAWSTCLFGLLPALFVASLLVPGTMSVLRYVFLGLTVCGLGGMWYRQMYTPTTRLAVSVGYLALCVVAIVMLMQGSTDARNVSSTNLSQSQTAQATPAPDGASPLAANSPEVTQAPTPTPTVTGPSAAEQRLELFMYQWQVNNVDQMSSLVKPSWASSQENPSQALFALLKNRTPEEFTIEDISGSEQDSSRTITMSATIDKNNGKAPSIYRFMVVMSKEGGEWYVDPNSLATNDEVEKKADENVVNNQAVASATEPPRQTVTPAPPASTLLYYNPDNGHYYHMDPNCPSIAAEYLPLTGSFPYSDLRSYQNKLTPCLKCGAPVDPLD